MNETPVVEAVVEEQELDSSVGSNVALDSMVEEELLVEEISIDGMCGVY